MSAIVALLPVSWQDKAKGLVGAIGAVLGVLSLTVHSTWLTTAIEVATALGVYATPNLVRGEGNGAEGV